MVVRKLAAVVALSALAVGAGAVTYAEAFAGPASSSVGSMSPAAFVWKQSFQDCAEGSAAAIIGSLTGSAPSEADITAFALTLTDPWSGQAGYTATGGTQMWALTPLYFNYGLHATELAGLTVAQLETELKHGFRAQAIVDSGQLWSDSGMNKAAAPTNMPDHAVVVDTIDPVADQVRVTDSGYGTTETVTVAQFASMWAPGRNTVVLVQR